MINHLVWALSFSLAATREIDFSFSSCSYLDVSVRCVLPQPAIYSPPGNASACIGFPHSDVSGSLRTYRSPKPFVVRHVLLRLIVPRHSPCALLYLTLLKILSRSLFGNLFSFDCFSVFSWIIFSFQCTNSFEVLPSKLNNVFPTHVLPCARLTSLSIPALRLGLLFP